MRREIIIKTTTKSFRRKHFERHCINKNDTSRGNSACGIKKYCNQYIYICDIANSQPICFKFSCRTLSSKFVNCHIHLYPLQLYSTDPSIYNYNNISVLYHYCLGCFIYFKNKNIISQIHLLLLFSRFPPIMM